MTDIPMLTREQIEQTRADLTLGDLERARGEAGDDAELMAKIALRRRAELLGYIPVGTPLAEFLDRVRVTDIAYAFSDAVRNPLSSGIAVGSASSDGPDSP